MKNPVHSIELQNSKPKAVPRSVNADFLCLLIRDGLGIIKFTSLYGAVWCTRKDHRPDFWQVFEAPFHLLISFKTKTKSIMNPSFITKEEVRQLTQALEHAERNLLTLTTLVVLLSDSPTFCNMGSTMLTGLQEAVYNAETQFKQLERAIYAINPTQTPIS